MLGSAIGSVATAIVLLGYVLYLADQLKSRVVPNASSWALWTFGEVITLVVYGDLTSDPAKLAVPVACVLGSSSVLVLAILRGRFVMPDRIELLVVALDILVLVAWATHENLTLAYGLLLLSTTLSYVPILRSTYRRPSNERALTWCIWAASYSAFFLLTVIAWEGWIPLLLPALYVGLNGLVALLAIRGTRAA